MKARNSNDNFTPFRASIFAISPPINSWEKRLNNSFQPHRLLSSNLLTSATIAFIIGITFSSQLELSPPTVDILAIGLLVAVPLLFTLYFSIKPNRFIYFLLLFFVIIGTFHAQIRTQLPSQSHHIYNTLVDKQEAVLIGTMTQMAGFDSKTSRTIIQLKSIRFEKEHGWRTSHGNILIRLQGKWPKDILPGDTLTIRTTLHRPESFKTPGTFDYAQYLARKNIWVSGSVRSPLLIHKITEEHTFIHFLRYFPERTRTRIGAHIDAVVPVDQAGVYRAILIGDRSGLKETTLESFKKSGTMHILAISGLHMAVIGTLLYACIYWILSRSITLLLRYNVKKWAAFMTMPILIFYALLAGMNTPVVRSVIMSIIIILAICSDRKKSPAALLSLAAMIILITDPLQLYTVSFQLSFAATISILFFFPVLQSILFSELAVTKRPQPLCKYILRWILVGFLVSMVATLATVPISLYSFNRISLIGPVANLFMEPLICSWALVTGFIGIPFLFFAPDISTFFFQWGAIGIKYAVYAATFFARLPYSHIWYPTPPIWQIIFYYVGFYFILKKIQSTRKSVKTVLFAVVICLLFFLPFPRFISTGNDTLHMTFLDVGQGSSTLIEFPSGLLTLIDGGGSSYSQSTVGKRVVAPFLWHKGIRKLHIIAITHPDADHYNGLGFITKHFVPDNIWVKNTYGHDNTYKQFIADVQRLNIPTTIPFEGQTITAGNGSLECVANIGGWKRIDFETHGRSQENSGLVLKINTTNFSALFPGDIEKSFEKALIDRNYYLRADIVLAPHHGSKTSNSAGFLNASSSDFFIASASRASKGKFPHSRLASLCKKHGTTLLSTAEHGTIEVTVDKEYYRVYGYKKSENNPLLPLKRYLIDRRRLNLLTH